MSTVSISAIGDVDFNGLDLINHLLDVPTTIGKTILSPSRSHHESLNKKLKDSNSNVPVDIVETPNQLILYMDVPGLSKSDIQVTVEEENLLVVKSNGKRKRSEDEEEDEGFRYLRLERSRRKMMRKFRLPENCDVSGGISARCENGVLTVVVEKLPPVTKSKTVEVAIA